MSFGGMAEYALRGDEVFDAPPELDDVEPRRSPLPFHVGYLALHERAGLQAGETVLVAAAPARSGPRRSSSPSPPARGCIAVAGGPEKAALVAEPRAELAIDHTDRGHVRPRHGRTPGTAAPRSSIDPIGGEQTEAMLDAASPAGGRYVARRLQRRPRVRPHRPAAAQGVDGQLLRDRRDARLHRRCRSSCRRFGINPFPPRPAARCTPRCSSSSRPGSIRPVIGRRDRDRGRRRRARGPRARRTTGRTVVTLPTQ